MASDILARNNVKILGNPEGQTMLFAHGFGCDQNMWRFVVPAFETEYRIVLFDYVGCGKSEKAAYSAERYSSLNGYAQDVLDVCAALDLRDVIFVGHSVSSMIGVLASLQQPERFLRLLLISPSPRYINDGTDYVGGFERPEIDGLLSIMEKNDLGWASFLAPIVMKNPERPELTQELEDSFCAADPEATQRFARVTFLSDNRRDLSGATVPSLILQCSNDSIAPQAVGEYLSRHLPQSTLSLMEATGHSPHMSHPEETIGEIKGYIKGIGTPANTNAETNARC